MRHLATITPGLCLLLLACSSRRESGEASYPTAASPATSHATSTRSDAQPGAPAAPTAAPPCLEPITVGRTGSILSEHRGQGVQVDDFATRYRADDIDPDRYRPVAAVQRYQIGSTPLLWYVEDKSEVVVNAAVLSDLNVAEVTSMHAGEAVTIGSLTELGRGKIDGRELAKFLIHSRTIGTYVHIGAELCLEQEERSGGSYHAVIAGEHTFFTNEENRRDVRFELLVDQQGAIEVRVP